MTIKFIKHIHAGFSSNHDEWLERTFDLPFTPFIGCEIIDGYFEYTIENLSWINSEQLFSCYVGSDKTFYDKALTQDNPFSISYHNEPEFEKLIEKYLEIGWTRKA